MSDGALGTMQEYPSPIIPAASPAQQLTWAECNVDSSLFTFTSLRLVIPIPELWIQPQWQVSLLAEVDPLASITGVVLQIEFFPVARGKRPVHNPTTLMEG